MADITETRMTVEQFLDLPETTQIVQLIHGEVIMSPSPTDLHQILVAAIYVFLKAVVPGGNLRMSPLDVYIGNGAVVQPDIFWVRENSEHCVLVEDRFWRGAPDLVVEVLSSVTAQLDFGAKFNIYEEYGVKEYWLVDQQGLFVHVFRLDTGKFARLGVFGKGQRFVSAVLGDYEVDITTLLEQ